MKQTFSAIRRVLPIVVLLLVLLLAVVSFAACKDDPTPCTAHADENADGICDVCGESVAPAPCTAHADADLNGVCDACGATVPIPCTAHADANCDGKCDNCAAAVTVIHLDTVADGVCDKCGACLEHRDDNCNDVCDNCATVVQIGHEDEDDDGECDKCGDCVAHEDDDCNGQCDKCETAVAVIHKDEVGSDNLCDKCGAQVLPITFSATKTASVPRGKTLYPAQYIAWSNTTLRGAYLTYTIRVTNTGENVATVQITDTVPTNTRFVSGCENKVGDALTWTVTVPVGETRTITYTVAVTATAAGTVEGDGAMVNDTPVGCYDLYIEQTLNEVDMKYLEKAIRVLSKSSYNARAFALWAYGVAYTKTEAISGIWALDDTPADILDAIFAGENEKLISAIAPGLYGGMSSSAILGAKGACNAAFDTTDLLTGDLLFVRTNGQTKLYIVCADVLYDITATAVKVDIGAVLDALSVSEKYAVLRPSIALTGFHSTDPDQTPAVMNAYQEALVKTAETFLLRGENLQYDDVWFGLASTTGEHRWTHGQKTPEEYTYDEWGYVNCAVFTYDVYLNALGYALPNNMYTTANLASQSEGLGMRMFYFENTTPGNYTDAYKLELERQFMSTLQIGDLVVVRRKTASGTSGHVMMYIGNGKLIHSTGSSYKSVDGIGTEVYEPTVRYLNVSDYLFTPTSTNYPFRGSDSLSTTYVQYLLIVRPLNGFSGSIPANTTARIQNMQDIRADKLSSHASSVSVNPGDEITFTFSIFNVGTQSRTVAIYDKVPTGTTYVSGGQSVSGDELRWTVTVLPGETVTVSYVVRVNNVADGTLIDGRDATVGGVKHRCAAIRVKNTLTATQQTAIKSAVEALKNEGSTLSKLAMVNEIYRRALGVENIFADTNVNNVIREGSESVFATSTVKNGTRYLSCLRTTETAYSRMLVDHLYGGMRFDSSAKLYDRTKLLKEHNLVVGDILIGRTASAEYVYIYVGDGQLIALNSGVGSAADFKGLSERIMYYARDFAVLRPSYVIGQ